METISRKVEETIKKIEEMCDKGPDLVSRKMQIGKHTIAYVYLESVSSDDKISDFLVKKLSYKASEKSTMFDNLFENLKNTIPNSKLSIVEDYENFFYYLASGFTAILVQGVAKAIVVETKSTLDHGITESNAEKVIRGPKDSFTENHMINVGLIRKRIKDPKLWMKETIVGKRTKTKVTVVYLEDIADLEKVDTIMDTLNKIDIDGILDSGYIRELLFEKQKSVFPKIISTERPDAVCGSLLEGKIAILVENTPVALVIPGVLVDFFHSPEDYYQKPLNVTFSRCLRIMAFLMTLLVPAIYISVMTFNQEVIPDELLISLAIQREGVPFPTAIEVLFLGLTFEILRETEVRVPKAMGTAISIVGALVLGDAAVSAGIISPIVLIVVAVTAICGLLFNDIDMINGLRWWRFTFIFLSAFMGLVGMVVAGLILIIKFSRLEVFGVPYLSPLSPFNLGEQGDAIIRAPRNKLKKRPTYLTKKNITRFKEETNEK